MYPAPFDYHRATSVDDVLTLLAEHTDTAKLLAGGHSLLPVMKLRLAQPELLIDINDLDELRNISVEADHITIGAMVTHHTLATNPEIASAVSLLVEIAHVVGDQQVRNLGTIGGALAHADPAADYPAGMLALDASIVAMSANGERAIPIDEFFTGFLTTALEPAELLTAIRIPRTGDSFGAAYEKLANPASGYATVGIAVALTTDTAGEIDSIRIGVTGTGASAYRPTSVEEALIGSAGDNATLKAAVRTATDGIDVMEDKHGPADYRARVTQNLIRRAVFRALASANGA
ncbi:MAG: xanthine dehydrogenase family protein subunit M [Chloroflexia bacterium]|jgi:carbon-monoxide dehydrogenase medium subunit|nr:xanthine dehydrogenase family protein subunit M [Chloroflexia bacterium]